MKAERLILSFVAIIIGLAVAGLAFYLYQMTKVESTTPKNIVKADKTPTPTPNDSLFLTLDSPKNEEVTSSKTLKISGKTTPDAIIIVNTETNDEVVKPASNGTFTLTQTISSGVNLLQVTALFPSGEEKKIQRTITYNVESF